MIKRPYPWEAPGYRFSIDWPPGFVPQEESKRASIDWSESAARSRQTALSRGITGTIKGLSSVTGAVRGDATKGLVGRKKPKKAETK